MDNYTNIDVVYNMDCLMGLKKLPSDFVDCCITSPPYFGLRDYGVDGQIGLEDSPSDYIGRLADVFTEVYRVMKSTGTLWLVIGDSYAGSMKGAAMDPENAKRYKQGSNKGTSFANTSYKYKYNKEWQCKNKDLIGIPWMLAFELRNRGWYLRQDIIWHKTNGMPESVKDRCTKSHEYVFLMSKSPRYYFDNSAIAEPTKTPPRHHDTVYAHRYGGYKYTQYPDKFFKTKSGNAYRHVDKKNKRDVWSIAVAREKENHFATFPVQLIEPCVLAGCPRDGIILDPFMGSGTVAKVALMYGRHYVGFELNPEYVEIIHRKTLVQQKFEF